VTTSFRLFQASPFSPSAGSQKPGWHTCIDATLLNTPSYYTPRSYHGTRRNPNPVKNANAYSNPNIIFHNNPLTSQSLFHDRHRGIREVVIGWNNNRVAGNLDTIADPETAVAIKDAKWIDAGVISDLDPTAVRPQACKLQYLAMPSDDYTFAIMILKACLRMHKRATADSDSLQPVNHRGDPLITVYQKAIQSSGYTLPVLFYEGEMRAVAGSIHL
jgi:hypothetical protein